MRPTVTLPFAYRPSGSDPGRALAEKARIHAAMLCPPFATGVAGQTRRAAKHPSGHAVLRRTQDAQELDCSDPCLLPRSLPVQLEEKNLLPHPLNIGRITGLEHFPFKAGQSSSENAFKISILLILRQRFLIQCERKLL